MALVHRGSTAVVVPTDPELLIPAPRHPGPFADAAYVVKHEERFRRIGF
jgi:hypothetical protein